MKNPLASIDFKASLVTPEVLWLGFFVVTLVFTIHALVVMYHWLTYGTNKNFSFTAILIYIGGGALFLLSLLIIIFAIT